MKIGMVRWDGRGPWAALHERLEDEEGFAVGEHSNTFAGPAGALAAQLHADLAVDFGGDEDAAA